MHVQLKNWVIPTLAEIASFGAGIGVGYFLSRIKRKNLESKLENVEEDLRSEIVQLEFKFEERDERLNSVIQQADQVVRKFKDEGRTCLDKHAGAPIQPAVRAAKDRHPSRANETILEPIDDEEDDVMVNVFRNETERDDNWDYDEEVKHRSPDHPYIIHKDEYDSDEMDFSQSSLMYYQADDVLCDEHDVPVYNAEKIVGKLIFGHGSLDPSIVYVRNEDLMAEWEIILDRGAFQTEVLGQEIEGNLKHSRPVLKFRME